jgi:hypothetical protein
MTRTASRIRANAVFNQDTRDQLHAAAGEWVHIRTYQTRRANTLVPDGFEIRWTYRDTLAQLWARWVGNL